MGFHIGFLVGVITGSIGTLLSIYVKQKVQEEGRNRDDIYRPLSNEVTDAKTGDLPIVDGTDTYGIPDFQSEWEEFDEYSGLLIDRDLREMLDDYVEALNRYERWVEGGDESRFVKRMPEEVLFEENGSARLLMEGDSEGDRTSISLRGFLQRFRTEIEEADNPEELRTGIGEEAERLVEEDDYDDSQLNALSRWDEVAPNWYEELWDLTRDAPEGDVWWAVKNTPDFFSRVKTKAENVETELEKRINAGFVKGIYYQLKPRG